MGLFCPTVQKTYSNFSSYTHSYGRWTVEDSIIERTLADLSSAIKSLIISPYKTADKSLV